MKEIRKDIQWYKWLYQVSNLWNVRKVMVMKKWWWTSWYDHVVLSKKWVHKTIQIHRLVALAFLFNKDNKEMVNHKDWNKKNNNLKNLERVTRSENCKHAYAIWLCKPLIIKWSDNKRSKKVWQYNINWDLIRVRWSAREVQRTMCIYQSDINRCCNNKRKTARGFIWKYIA